MSQTKRKRGDARTRYFVPRLARNYAVEAMATLEASAIVKLVNSRASRVELDPARDADAIVAHWKEMFHAGWRIVEVDLVEVA